MYENYLAHYGVKGMKWGVRRYHNKDGSLNLRGIRRYGYDNTRVLKKGTEIQNITARKYDTDNKRSNRLYGAYTDADKIKYADHMANWQYNGHGYRNLFTVKKNINIASEREALKTFEKMCEENPKMMAKTMRSAYETVQVPLFMLRSTNMYEKKIERMLKNPDDRKSIKLGREFVSNIPMSLKYKDVADDFYARMIKKGFDAVLDTNDGYGIGKAQDPLIIFNMKKLGNVNTVGLDKNDLDKLYKYTATKEFNARVKDTRGIVR